MPQITQQGLLYSGEIAAYKNPLQYGPITSRQSLTYTHFP